MAKLSLLAGTTSKIVKIFIQNSSVTTGAGLTGLTSGSSGLTCYYVREGDSASTSVALQSATLGTWTTRGFIVVDGTNMSGLYEFGIPNAAIAAGAKSVVVVFQGATNMVPCVLEIELTAIDNQATNFGLVTTGFTISAVSGAVGSVTGAVGSVTGLTASNLDATITSRMASYTQPTGFLAATFPSGTVANTTNITAGTITTVTNLTNAPTSGDFTATMKTSLNSSTPASITGAVGSVTGNVGGSVASVTAAVTASGTSPLTEAYPAAGAALTLASALYTINQFLSNHSTSSTTWTVKKRDGSTTAKTYTLDSATAPTSLAEAT